jgi:hypothetical protein
VNAGTPNTRNLCNRRGEIYPRQPQATCPASRDANPSAVYGRHAEIDRELP